LDDAHFSIRLQGALKIRLRLRVILTDTSSLGHLQAPGSIILLAPPPAARDRGSAQVKHFLEQGQKKLISKIEGTCTLFARRSQNANYRKLRVRRCRTFSPVVKFKVRNWHLRSHRRRRRHRRHRIKITSSATMDASKPKGID
jgi:hypothetical protein